MQGNETIHFVDAATVQDTNSGERTRVIQSITSLRCEVGPVGATSFWQATSQNIRLDKAIYVKGMSYKNQKYFYSPKDDMVYEYFNTGKGRNPTELSIYGTALEDTTFKELIKNALGIT